MSFVLKKATRALLLIRRNILLVFSAKRKADDTAQQFEYDLVYVCHEKDIEVLEKSLSVTISNIAGRMSKLYLIYPETQSAVFRQKFAHVQYEEYTDESLFRIYLSDNTLETLLSLKRSGWIKQQILKFLAAQIVKKDHYLVVDADTIIIDQMFFVDKGKTIFYYSDEWEYSYRNFIRKVTGERMDSIKSFVSHMSLFSVKNVMALFSFLSTRAKEGKNATEIDRACSFLIASNQFEQHCVMSEYELYYFFTAHILKEPVLTSYWRNKALNLNTWDGNVKQYQKAYLSISFHDYYRQ